MVFLIKCWFPGISLLSNAAAQFVHSRWIGQETCNLIQTRMFKGKSSFVCFKDDNPRGIYVLNSKTLLMMI
jgi:hypothetical protein